MLYAARDKQNPLTASTWRAALNVLVQARLPLAAARVGERVARLSRHRLQEILPPSVVKAIGLKGSPTWKKGLLKVLRPLLRVPMISDCIRMLFKAIEKIDAEEECEEAASGDLEDPRV